MTPSLYMRTKASVTARCRGMGKRGMRMRGTRGKAEYVHAHKSLHHTARCRGAGLGVRVESCRLVKQSLSVCRGTAQTTGQAAQGHQRRA